MASIAGQSFSDTDHLSLSGSSPYAHNTVFFGSSTSLFCVSLFSFLIVGAVAKEKISFLFLFSAAPEGKLLLMQLETFFLHNCLESAFRLLDSNPLKRAMMLDSGSRLVKQQERYGAYGGLSSFTDWAVAQQYFCWLATSFFLRVEMGKNSCSSAYQKLQRVARRHPCLPIFTATSALQLCVVRKVEPHRELAVIHRDAAKQW